MKPDTSRVTFGFRHTPSLYYPPVVSGSALIWASPSVATRGTAGTSTISLSRGIITFPQGTCIPGSPPLVLQQALQVEIENTRDGVVLRSGALDEEAFGSGYDEACLDFLTSLRDRYDSLSRREERLADQDRSVLERLRGLLRSDRESNRGSEVPGEK